MKPLYKVYFLIFAQLAAPALVVGGFIINAVLLDIPSLPRGIKQELNWLQQNPDRSESLMTAMFVIAGILAALAVWTAISIARSKKGGEDTRLGIGLERRKKF